MRHNKRLLLVVMIVACLVMLGMVATGFSAQQTNKQQTPAVKQTAPPLQQGQLPDLTIVDIALNKECFVVVTAQNNGPGALPDKVWTDHSDDAAGIYVHINGKQGGGQSIWYFDPDKNLQKPGGTATMTYNQKVTGTAMVDAYIDRTYRVKETDEKNNAMKKKLTCAAVTTTQPGQQGQPSGPVHVKAQLGVKPPVYSGNCPALISFRGHITVNQPTTVQYKFIRSDNASAPVQTLTFPKAGTQEVTETWQLGGPSLPTYSGWEAIEVISPISVKSNKAEFRIKCADAGQAGQQVAPVRVKADLDVKPASYSGNCPALITFKGHITVNQPTTVQYKFIRSDNASAPIQTLNFPKAGTQEVTTTWQIGGPSLPTFSGWEAIEVISPISVKSNKAEFKVRCTGQGQQTGQQGIPIDVEAKLSAKPVSYTGNCPALITFGGYIAVNQPMTVQYRFIRSDNASAPIQTLHFSSKSRQEVTTTWQLGGPGLPTYSGWEAIEVISPISVKSNKAEFNIRCAGQGQQGGTGQQVQPGVVMQPGVTTQPVGTAQPAVGKEDCISFNPATTTAQQIQGSWKVVDGSHWLFDFGAKKDEAERALAIIKQYRMNQSCFVGRPQASFQYMLVSGSSPAGTFAGEDCVSFNPVTTTAQQIKGSWKVVDGSHWIFDFGSKESEAKQTLAIIKKYGFTRSCYVGRPNPSFSYLRK